MDDREIARAALDRQTRARKYRMCELPGWEAWCQRKLDEGVTDAYIAHFDGVTMWLLPEEVAEVTDKTFDQLLASLRSELDGDEAPMSAGSLEFWVLNATADDWESLDQIHPRVNERRPTERRALAGEILRLLRAGLLEVMPPAPKDTAAILAEPLDYWFRMTAQGRTKWTEAAKEMRSK